MSLFVFGHRNPDTDAICSAIAYADFLQKTTRPDAVAACCGPPNERTEFALRKAGLHAPRIIMDVRPVVEDVCQREIKVASDSDCFYEVYRKMEEHQLRTIPIMDTHGNLSGLVTLLDLLELVLQGGVDPVRSREVHSNLNKIVDVLGGTFQHQANTDQNEELIVTVGAMSAGGFTQHMQEFPAERLLVVSGDRPTIQLPALETGVRALVVTGGYELSSGLMELARTRGVNVINLSLIHI